MTSTTDDLAELEELDDNILCQCLNDRYQLDQINVSGAQTVLSFGRDDDEPPPPSYDNF